MTDRVIQGATGGVGRGAIDAIATHPELELVGCWVHSEEKVGRDAGELAGCGALGVAATHDVDEIVAMDADCVLYSPMVANPKEIARLSGVEEGGTIDILRRLDHPHRLVRPLQQESETRYELAHEVLGPPIMDWIRDSTEREAKAIHDLLRAELHNWQRFSALPGPGKLRVVHAQQDNPHLRLGPDEVRLIARGALQHGVELVTWLERAGADPGASRGATALA